MAIIIEPGDSARAKVYVAGREPVLGALGQAIVYPGETITADVVWKNVGFTWFTPRLRLDIRESGWATWIEGPWITSPGANPGYTATVTPYRQVPGDWDPNTTIDVKIMVEGIPGEVWLANDIFITGPKPIEEYELIQHTIYPYAYVYDGDDETTTATFRIDPFTPSAWAAKKLADSVASEAAKNGSRVIELKACVDTSPLLWTDIKIELTATPIGGVTAAGVGAIGIPLWAGILIAALAIIGVIVAFTILVKTIAGAFQHKALSEEIKVTWSRETLISVIGDFEEKLELTPTPPETLAEKSDQELRDYCNVLARGIVPPGLEIPWELVVVGGLAVLGVGAAVALAPKKKE